MFCMNNELYAVIDIGSNSVRLMMHDGAKTLSKEIKITKLATGISFNRMLNEDAMDKTLSAVAFFVEKAKKQNASIIK